MLQWCRNQLNFLNYNISIPIAGFYYCIRRKQSATSTLVIRLRNPLYCCLNQTKRKPPCQRACVCNDGTHFFSGPCMCKKAPWVFPENPGEPSKFRGLFKLSREQMSRNCFTPKLSHGYTFSMPKSSPGLVLTDGQYYDFWDNKWKTSSEIEKRISTPD